jgi:hypothetical protein
MSMPSSRRLPATSRKPASNRPTTRPAIQTHERTIATATAATDTATVATAAGIVVIAEVIDAEAVTAITVVGMTADRGPAEVTVMTDTDEVAHATVTVEGEGIEAVTITVAEDVLARALPVVTDHVARGKDLVNAVLARSAKEAAVRRPQPQKPLKTIVTNVLSSYSRSPSVPRHATSARSLKPLDLSSKHRLSKTE